MPWHRRLIILGGIALLIYAGFWYFVTKSMHAEVDALKEQVASLQKQNVGAQIASQRLNEFRARYQSKQEEYDDLKALLPEQRELTSVLQGVQHRSQASHLSLRRFTPKEDFQQEFYSGKPIEIEVSSTFGNLRAFFEQMARYQRIVSITDFKINRIEKGKGEQSASRTVDAQFLMTAYYVSAEKLQKQAASQTPAPAASPAAAAPAAAK